MSSFLTSSKGSKTTPVRGRLLDEPFAAQTMDPFPNFSGMHFKQAGEELGVKMLSPWVLVKREKPGAALRSMAE